MSYSRLLCRRSVDELKRRAQGLETVMEKFQISHDNYHQNLKDEENTEESNEYFEAEQTRVNYLIERIMNVIEHQSSIVPDIIDPHDSVSNTRKGKLSSKHTKISYKSGSRISWRYCKKNCVYNKNKKYLISK